MRRIIISILYFQLIACSHDERTVSREQSIISEIVDDVYEIDPRISFGPDSAVLYSRYESGFYNLYRMVDSRSEKISQDKNCYYPFFIGDGIGYLSRKKGGVTMVSNVSFAEVKKESTELQWVYSFNAGQYLLFALESDNTIYFYDHRNETSYPVAQVTSRFIGYAFSSDTDLLVISYDEKLLTFDPKTLKIVEIRTDLPGEKINPYLAHGKIYFSSNAESDFYKIYVVDINGSDSRKEVRIVYEKKGRDLRLPKIYEKKLFFIEVVNSQYLLRSYNFANGQVTTVTDSGVVYDYFALSDQKVILLFSDVTTPKSLNVIDLNSCLLDNLTQSPIEVPISCSFIKKPQLCPAYIVRSKQIERPKGLILFFRPGEHGDFSPRWDTILMTLCKLGYVVVAPNYHGSSGYGKTFAESDISRSVEDMVAWTHYLKSVYPEAPLFAMAFSSGNVIMEPVLTQTPQDVVAAVSFFGTESFIEPGLIKVPATYFLGVEDPVVNVEHRYAQLIGAGVPPDNIIRFKNEGHWLIDHENIKKAICQMDEFFGSKRL